MYYCKNCKRTIDVTEKLGEKCIYCENTKQIDQRAIDWLDGLLVAELQAMVEAGVSEQFIEYRHVCFWLDELHKLKN